MSVPQNIVVCCGCPHCKFYPAKSKRICEYDPAQPVPMVDRAESGVCPIGEFKLSTAGNEPDPQSPPLPAQMFAGDLTELVIKKFGADRLAEFLTRRKFRNGQCAGCGTRKKRWNELDRKLRRKLGLSV